MKGLIICGYPGVGKSSVAGWGKCIDLESSWFSQDKDGNHIYPDEAWCEKYCELAIYLASQGFTVLLSTHQAVINTLRDYQLMLKCYRVKVVIFAPRPGMKKEWTLRLFNRYMESEEEKDLRAFVGAIEYWDSKLATIAHSDFPVYSPDTIDYDFRDYILKIREREWIVDAPKTGSPLEPMAGVAETSMDVPMVAKDPDISTSEP